MHWNILCTFLAKMLNLWKEIKMFQMILVIENWLDEWRQMVLFQSLSKFIKKCKKEENTIQSFRSGKYYYEKKISNSVDLMKNLLKKGFQVDMQMRKKTPQDLICSCVNLMFLKKSFWRFELFSLDEIVVEIAPNFPVGNIFDHD